MWRIIVNSVLNISILLLFWGCNLLNPEVKETTSVTNTIEGTWIQAGSTPLEIIQFSESTLQRYRYNPIDSVIDTASGTFVMFSSESKLIISFSTGELDTVQYELGDDQVSIKSGSSNEKFYTRWSGTIPHPNWKKREITQFSISSGSYNQGVPVGAWRNSDATSAEVIMIWADTLKVYTYISSSDSLNINVISYAINSEKTAFVLNDENGSPIEVVPYSYSNGILTIQEPESSEQGRYFAFDQNKLPWSFSKIGYDSEEMSKPIDGKWISNDRTFIISLYSDTLENLYYNATDSVIERHVNRYYFNQAKDTIVLEISSTSKQYIGVQYNGDNLLSITISGGEPIALTHHYGELILDWWVEKVVVSNPLIGTWGLAGDTPAEILQIDDSEIVGYSYDSDSETIDTSYYSYGRNTTNDTITLYWSDYSMSFQYYFANDTLYLEDDEYIYTYAHYYGKIPHDSWDVQTSYSSNTILRNNVFKQ